MTMTHFQSVPIVKAVRAPFSWGKLGRRLGIGLGTAGIVIFAIFPLYWMVVVALSKLGSSRGASQTIFPTSLSFDNFAYVFTEVPLSMWLINSAIVASIVSLGATIVGAMAGYSLARFHSRWTGLFVLVILATQLMPHHRQSQPRAADRHFPPARLLPLDPA
jgi:multiple sugar transport system permease protein